MSWTKAANDITWENYMKRQVYCPFSFAYFWNLSWKAQATSLGPEFTLGSWKPRDLLWKGKENWKRTPLLSSPMKMSAGWLHTSLGASFSSPFSSPGELMLTVPLEQGNRNVPHTWHIQLHRTWQTIVTRNQVQWEVRGKLHYLANYN